MEGGGGNPASYSVRAFLAVRHDKRRPGDIPSRPSSSVRAPRGNRVLWVEIPTELALKLELLWARTSAEMTQKQLAKRSGLSRRVVARLEDPDIPARLNDFDIAFAALGLRLQVELTSM